MLILADKIILSSLNVMGRNRYCKIPKPSSGAKFLKTERVQGDITRHQGFGAHIRRYTLLESMDFDK